MRGALGLWLLVGWAGLVACAVGAVAENVSFEENGVGDGGGGGFMPLSNGNGGLGVDQGGFLAVGRPAIGGGGTGSQAMISYDGEQWDAQSTPSNAHWHGIAWAPEIPLFVSVAQDGVSGSVMTSPDGVAWTQQTAASSAPWQSVAWSPELELFAAVARDGVNRVMTSTDGETWTSRTAAEQNAWRDIVWAPGLESFVAVASTGTNRVMLSTDGETWTAHEAAEQNEWWRLDWSPSQELLVAVARDGTNRVMVSSDGESWTAHEAAADSRWWHITRAEELNLWVAVADAGTTRIMTSPDGETWTGRTAPAAQGWRSVAWNRDLELLAATSTDGTNRVMTSPDGVSWTLQSTPNQQRWDWIISVEEIVEAPEPVPGQVTVSPLAIVADGFQVSMINVSTEEEGNVTITTSHGYIFGAGDVIGQEGVQATEIGEGSWQAMLRCIEPGLAQVSASQGGASVGDGAQVLCAPMPVSSSVDIANITVDFPDALPLETGIDWWLPFLVLFLFVVVATWRGWFMAVLPAYAGMILFLWDPPLMGGGVFAMAMVLVFLGFHAVKEAFEAHREMRLNRMVPGGRRR